MKTKEIKVDKTSKVNEEAMDFEKRKDEEEKMKAGDLSSNLDGYSGSWGTKSICNFRVGQPQGLGFDV